MDKHFGLENNANEKTLRTLSIVFNWILGILILPALPFSFMVGVATMMMSDSGSVGNVGMRLVPLTSYMFLAIPIIMAISIILSFRARKKLKYLLSNTVQLIPVVYTLVAFGLFYLIPRIG